ncbi:MAG TPA: serine hydrolase domain-containing protein [Candidatus Tumulicola sp.]|jgi:CubicO group peptidase (beta-lactamase class C family)
MLHRSFVVRAAAGLAIVAQLLVAQPAAAQAVTPADPHIAGVERELQPQFYLTGRPRVTHTLAERMRFYKVPAVSIAVIDDYRVAWTAAYGFRDVAAHEPAETATLFQAASMSKPVFAAAVLSLFATKGLSIDADINTLLRSWTVPPAPGNSAQPVTLRRILNHTAGTNVHGFAGYDRDATLPTLVRVLNGAPPANSEAIRVVKTPGGASEYSGGGTTIGQQLAIDVSGAPFPEFMQQTLLQPLDMNASTYQQPLPQSLWDRAADGYYADGKPVHRGWHVYPEMAAAGLWTTAADLATFVIAIQDALRGQTRGPITPAIAREMTTPNAQGFGLGTVIDGQTFGHDGANEGFQGLFTGSLRGGRGIVVLTNSDNGGTLARQIVYAVGAAYGWPEFSAKPKAALKLSPAALKPFAGQYAAGAGDQRVVLSVRLVGDGLTVSESFAPGDVPIYAQSARSSASTVRRSPSRAIQVAACGRSKFSVRPLRGSSA